MYYLSALLHLYLPSHFLRFHSIFTHEKKTALMVPLWIALGNKAVPLNVNFPSSFNMINAVSVRKHLNRKIWTDITHALSILAPLGMIYKVNVAYTCHNNLHRIMIFDIRKHQPSIVLVARTKCNLYWWISAAQRYFNV